MLTTLEKKKFTTICLICKRIEMIKVRENPYFVAELKSGYVVVCDHQYFFGHTLFLQKNHGACRCCEKQSSLFIKEMTRVFNAVYFAFQPKKIECEILNTSQKHNRCHFIPRYEHEDYLAKHCWDIDKKIRQSQKASLTEIENIKKVLLEGLCKVNADILS